MGAWVLYFILSSEGKSSQTATYFQSELACQNASKALIPEPDQVMPNYRYYNFMHYNEKAFCLPTDIPATK